MKETLEEVAKGILTTNGLSDKDMILSDTFLKVVNSMVDMAKWQQQNSYSEEEVKTIINGIVEKHCTYFEQKLKDDIKLEWFEHYNK